MKRRTLLLPVLLALAVFGAGCEKAGKANEARKAEQAISGDTASRSIKVVGAPKVSHFAEKTNLRKRYEELDDPNATGYIYLINYGLIFAEFRVKGKVSSMGSQFTNPEQSLKPCDSCDRITLPQQEPDGSYGDNPEGIFFWTTDGVYKEWTGDYLYTKERVELQQPPQISVTKAAG